MHWSIGFMVVCLLASSALQAVEQINLDIQKMTGDSWQLRKLRLVLEHLSDATPSLVLTADQLTLPPPLNQLSLFSYVVPALISNQARFSVRTEVSIEFGGKPLVSAFNFSSRYRSELFSYAGIAYSKTHTYRWTSAG